MYNKYLRFYVIIAWFGMTALVPLVAERAFAKSAQDDRRIEEENREVLRPTELADVATTQVVERPAEVPVDDQAYFTQLFDQKHALRADLYRCVSLLTGGAQAADLPDAQAQEPLRKGYAALVFYRALEIKGGIWLRLFGVSERYALRELEFQGIMYGGSTDEIVSGRELVFILTRAAEYLSKRTQQQLGTMQWPQPQKVSTLKRVVYDYGGWFNLRFVDFNEDDNDSSSIDSTDSHSLIDSRIWFKATIKPPLDADYDNEHSVYIRLKDLVIERRPDDLAGGGDHDGPHLDYAYLSLDLRPFWVEGGRKYFSIGQGIAYSNVNDGIELVATGERWYIKGFVAHTLPHEDNVDLSVPGYDKESDRYFTGVEYRYGFANAHDIYGYVLVQRDFSNEQPEDGANDYTYDSEYFGIGAAGILFGAVSYDTELIKETGESVIFATGEKKDVDAWAAVANLHYQPEIYGSPRISVGSGFGSGDADRGSVTDTQNGNSNGTDKNFLYFGYLETGYALSARLSNLIYYKAGISFQPFEDHAVLQRLRVGVDAYRYYKHKTAGAIYDTEATVADTDLGYEVDAYLSWDITSELSCNLQYGHFHPGDAYPDSANDSEDYFSVSMSITF